MEAAAFSVGQQRSLFSKNAFGYLDTNVRFMSAGLVDVVISVLLHVLPVRVAAQCISSSASLRLVCICQLSSQ